MTFHSAKKTQMALFLAKKVNILVKYLDFTNVLLEQSANLLLEQIKANEHTIELEKSKQPLYRPIYSLGLIKLKTFKTYIETNLANGFIRTLKSLADTPIFFD